MSVLKKIGDSIFSGITGGLTSGIKTRIHNRIGHNVTAPSSLQQGQISSTPVATPTSLSDNIEAQKDLADHNTHNQMLLETHRANLQKGSKTTLIDSIAENYGSLQGMFNNYMKSFAPNKFNTTNLQTTTDSTDYIRLPDLSNKRPYRPKGTHGKYRP